MKTDNSKQNFSIRLFFIALIWALVLFVIAVLFYKDSILYSIIIFAAKTNNQFVYERIIWYPDLFEQPCLEAIRKEQYPQEISRFICSMQPLKIEIVRKLAENNNAEVRVQAIKTLGESGDKSSISLIIKSLSDKNEEVAVSAMFALAHLKAT
ncbi:MAG: HEAT repeat domain-containing protein, partial [Firmicutes bacterium]|nr:HEAT repeat domain-containing protein [Bacillota bacterium]